MTKVMSLIAIAIAAGVLCFNTIPDIISSTTRSESKNEVSGQSRTTRGTELARNSTPHNPLQVGHPLFASPHANPIAAHGRHVFVVNTPADTVDVIDAKSKTITHRIPVGIDPVSIAIRPDGKEIWVSNHVSDSVSVIDTDSTSATYLHVIATIQEFDPQTKATLFDEPVGIAFASNEKAYIALSSENKIAVVDAKSHQISSHLRIPAQDPRAIFVRNDRLYVIPFESNNKTQLSGGARRDIDGELVTFDAWEHSIRVNNVLSLGHKTDIVKHPDVPDRDLFVFDTKTDRLVETVDSLGTLLYGLTVSSKGDVYIAQSDARNDVNGRAGTKKHSLKELGNRAFLNQITKVSFTEGKAQEPELMELEPLPPTQPEPGRALATPYAIQLSDDDSTLVATAAGSDKLFTVDAQSGKVLGRIAVGAVPRGIALENSKKGKPEIAWVYNAVANTVSCIDLVDPSEPKIAGFIKLEDPTHPSVKLGRTWFNDADASTTGTFSCASCHPDGHSDQLLWVLKTPVVSGGDQIMPRSTMPISGLRDTAPFHWDGIPGDPYGGNNSANVHGSSPPNSDPHDPNSASRHLIDGGLATTMHLDGDKSVNDEGKIGKLSAAERDDMAKFLLSLTYPPAQRRAFDNKLSERAETGFKLFHIDGDNDPSKDRPNVCGNCHRMPFLVSTNTPGTGMDAPTWRGAYDRFLILPQGRLNIIEFPFYRRVAERGQSEEEIWRFSWGGRRRFNPIWSMVLEGSTGFSGTFARQVTLNSQTANDQLTNELLDALEVSATDGAIVLEGDGTILRGSDSQTISVQYDPTFQNGMYVNKANSSQFFSRQDLVSMASKGNLVATFTGRHGKHADISTPQPAIWTLGSIHEQRGRQKFPILFDENQFMSVSGRHFDESANVYVDGRRVKATIKTTGNQQEEVLIKFELLPEQGMHLLQVQTAQGLFSNDFIFHVVNNFEGAKKLRSELELPHTGPKDTLAKLVAVGDLEGLKRRIKRIRQINDPRGERGSTLLSTAALYGQVEVAKLLIESGADVNARNRDGNTPLHSAAFFCRNEMVNLLLKNGASETQKNNRRESPTDVVSGDWNNRLSGIYLGIANAIGIEIELDYIKQNRPIIKKRLEDKLEQ